MVLIHKRGPTAASSRLAILAIHNHGLPAMALVSVARGETYLPRSSAQVAWLWLAVQLLGDALALAEPGGFIRIFVDEGLPMAHLLSEAAAHGIMPDYTGKQTTLLKSKSMKRINIIQNKE